VYSLALHELGAHAFPDGLPPYPDWWAERMGRDGRAAPGEPAEPEAR
jgi:hypothetical protein